MTYKFGISFAATDTPVAQIDNPRHGKLSNYAILAVMLAALTSSSW